MRSPIRKSLLRQISWFGGDRRIVGGSAILLFGLGWTMFMGFGFYYGLPIIVPGVLLVGVLWVAKRSFKADPFMVEVILRAKNYRNYYPAKTHVGVEHPRVKDFVK